VELREHFDRLSANGGQAVARVHSGSGHASSVRAELVEALWSCAAHFDKLCANGDKW